MNLTVVLLLAAVLAPTLVWLATRGRAERRRTAGERPGDGTPAGRPKRRWWMP